MKWYSILLFTLLFVLTINACQLPEDPFSALTLDKEAKYQEYLAYFNERFPVGQSTDFEESVRAIEDPYHSFRRKSNWFPQGYVVLKYCHDTVTIEGVISSMRQFYEVLGPNYQYILTQTPYVFLKHFKELQLADGEIVNIGALLLGTNDMKIMLEVIKEDVKNDHAKMNNSKTVRN